MITDGNFKGCSSAIFLSRTCPSYVHKKQKTGILVVQSKLFLTLCVFTTVRRFKPIFLLAFLFHQEEHLGMSQQDIAFVNDSCLAILPKFLEFSSKYSINDVPIHCIEAESFDKWHLDILATICFLDKKDE